MKLVKDQILRILAPLVGKKLSIARRAADLRGLHFGKVTIEESGRCTYGEIALHNQCPWRIEGPEGIVTGRLDLWEPADRGEDLDWDSWDYDKEESLQDRRMLDLLGSWDGDTRSCTNETDRLVVETVSADEYGGAKLFLSGGYRIAIFPSGSIGEDWRLFRPSSKEEHFVVEGGRIVRSPEAAGGDSSAPEHDV